MDLDENSVSSSCKAYSPRTRSVLHAKDAATYLLQLSYQELLRESEKAEPRLSRLLGHVSLYENVAHWQTEAETGLRPFDKGKADVTSEILPASSNAFDFGQKANRVRSTATLSTLAEFQAFICEQMESKKVVTVMTEEVCSDSDFEDELGSDETYSDESGDYSESSDDEGNLIYWMIDQPTKSSSPHMIEGKLALKNSAATSNMDLINAECNKPNDRDTISQNLQAQV